MKISCKALLAAFWLLAGTAAAQPPVPHQDTGVLRKNVEQFLRMQTTGLPGEVKVAVGSVDKRLNLPACAAPEPFLPNGSRVWGKTTVGVRCTAPSPWTVYISATVRVIADYIVTAAPLAQGQLLGSNDIANVKGDLTSLPPGILTDTSQAVGRTVAISLAAGIPLRNDALRTQQVVQQGQTVRLVSTGPGFRVSAEARALNNAAEGQIAQARTASGQVISGVAKTSGVVEVTY